MNTQYPSKREIEEYLRIRPGSLDHIPHYAIGGAIMAINNIRAMEKEQLFRPGLYYIVLSDLCRSTEASAHLGKDLNIRRIESFILTCIEVLGAIGPRNYFLPLREIGDAVLIIFSSFEDVHDWWQTMQSWLAVSNLQWQLELSPDMYKHFEIEAKTVVHVGEVAYSANNVPVALAVNQIFKIEKIFSGGELGMTHAALVAASPIAISRNLNIVEREDVHLPGDTVPTKTYVVDNITKTEEGR